MLKVLSLLSTRLSHLDEWRNPIKYRKTSQGVIFSKNLSIIPKPKLEEALLSIENTLEVFQLLFTRLCQLDKWPNVIKYHGSVFFRNLRGIPKPGTEAIFPIFENMLKTSCLLFTKPSQLNKWHNLVRYRKTLQGGVFLKNLSGTPKPRIEEVPLPARVIIPLKQGYGGEVQPTVNPTDKVKAGQIIGIQDPSISSPVHASVNGTVEQIIKLKYLNEEVNAIVIKSDGSKEWIRIEGASSNFERKNPDEVGKILYTAGVTSLGSSGFPTRYNTSSAKPEGISDLIINAVNTEPFLPTNEILLKGSIDKFGTGLKILRQALPEVNVHIGINQQDNEVINEIVNASKGMDWLRIYPLKPKYPQEHEAVLTRTILGKVVPYGGHAADIGVIIFDVQSVLHAYEAVVEGKPLIERIVTLGGPAYKDNIAVKVRVGTPIEHILTNRIKEGVEKRVILGGIMTGLPTKDLSIPIIRTTSSITALKENKDREFLTFLRPGIDRHSFSYTFLSAVLPSWTKQNDTNIHGELRPCIACTYCTDACPVDMMPHLLSKYVKFGPLEETLKLNIHACIDCGLCTYVCPAKIPLMTDIQEGRRRIKEEVSL